jgi:hypothetical protein
MKDLIRLTQHMNNGKTEYVMCAANWINDGITYDYQPYNIEIGVVYCGWRHPCIFAQYFHYPDNMTTQGFLTTKNRFLTREEALVLVTENGQLKQPKIGSVLTSEDLW